MDQQCITVIFGVISSGLATDGEWDFVLDQLRVLDTRRALTGRLQAVGKFAFRLESIRLASIAVILVTVFLTISGAESAPAPNCRTGRGIASGEMRRTLRGRAWTAKVRASNRTSCKPSLFVFVFVRLGMSWPWRSRSMRDWARSTTRASSAPNSGVRYFLRRCLVFSGLNHVGFRPGSCGVS